ncbi:hypothetical protein [Streptomyces sp. CB02959]|uniref:hypothetical protein n=1 Tax=Streptomyces sp. CB02959 TaxID=2020330 RepID=UPI0011AF3546|nr:hypothetical protein [Streptomyces sp. CB02959]
MNIIITSDNESTLALWRARLSPFPQVQFTKERSADIEADAVAISGIYAFERYGGRPNSAIAQVITNTTGDGLPGLIIIPPSLPMVLGREKKPVVHPDYKQTSPAYYAISHTLQAIDALNSQGGRTVTTVIFSLPLLGMNSPHDESTPTSVGRAIEEYGHSR